MKILCSDLEGVFLPEIWINVAERTGIEDLRLTTRDISDYHVLMKHRLDILDKHGLKLKDIQAVIAAMSPLDGALDFINWVSERTTLIVVSDTFTQFAGPLMKPLNWPALLCNELDVTGDGRIKGYRLRQEDGKRKVAEAFQSLNYEVLAMGDSYNDISMLQAADHGILFQPPQNVIDEFPQFPVTRGYEELRAVLGPLIGN